MRIARTTLGILLLCAAPLTGLAQDNTATATNPPAGGTAAKPPAEEKKKEEKVARVTAVNGKKSVVMLGDTVTISVEHDDVFRKLVKTNTVTLFLNGQDAQIAPLDDSTSNYVFRLERNDDNKKLWERILESPFTEPQVPLHVSVGINDKDGKPVPVADGLTSLPVADNVKPLTLQKTDFKAPAPWIWIFLLIVVLFYFFYLVSTSDILRNGPATGGMKQAYSLGRSQMAWWMFIVIVSYVTIWMITGNRDTVPNSTLILLGISSATALGAVAIDSTASSRIKSAIDRLNGELTTLRAQLAAPDATDELKDALDARIAEIQKEKANIVKTPPSVNWLRDIITDDSGSIAVHRLQNLLWTFVLGVVFVVSVAHVLSMPTFNTTLLTLMGISGATYLGFKFPTTG
jgi:hypothetical protein